MKDTSHSAASWSHFWHDTSVPLSTEEARLDEEARVYWTKAKKPFDGTSDQSPLNVGEACSDRQVLALRGSKTAIIWVGLDHHAESISYGEICAQSTAFANVLNQLGVGRGEAVFTLLGRIPELFVVALGTLKEEAVFCPLFSAFGPDPIKIRMNLAKAVVLVTTDELFARKVAPILSQVPSLRHVIIVRSRARLGQDPLGLGPKGSPPSESVKLHYFRDLMDGAPSLMDRAETSQDTPSVIHFTSGTTGQPKAAVHVHESLVCHHDTAKTALGLTADDIYWCTADPGWVTGTSYGIFAPLSIGATLVLTEFDFDPDTWYQTIERFGVTVWYTAPTALRMLMKAGEEVAKPYRLTSLRHVASVGEPLNAAVVLWGERALGVTIHDTWWQTETGCIIIANPPGRPTVPGSMGIPVPGMRVAVVKNENLVPGHPLPLVTQPDMEGELAVRAPWPSLFRAYLGDEERYRRAFGDHWYLTGDLVRRDAQGYIWFVGRKDDVIKSSGHLIGPFEIESTLLEHPAVAEAAAIGIPDEMLGESIKAFVSLKTGFSPSDSLKRELMASARRHLGPAVAPRDLEFAESLPKTRSGKIMRRLLKARELGLPEGDLSTLEPGAPWPPQEGAPGKTTDLIPPIKKESRANLHP